MSENFVVPLVSILGVLISVIASVSVARLQNKTALEKIKKELEQQYAKSLFEQRVKTYPRLFEILSGYGKIIVYKKNNLENLRKFRDSLDEWNNANAIFFTVATAKLSGKFRGYLGNLLSNSDSTISDKEWDAVRTIIRAFENSIRSEIGVIDMPPVGTAKELDKMYEFIDNWRTDTSRQNKEKGN
jgi:hypothetical protein